MIRATTYLLIVVCSFFVLAGCSKSDDFESNKKEDKTVNNSDSGVRSDATVVARNGKYDAAPTIRLDPTKSWAVKLETSKGNINIDLDVKKAPIAAANFVYLVKEGFYDGTKFHRVIKNFMIQGGDPLGTGQGGPGYTIKDEAVKGNYVRGAVAMAKTIEPNSAGSQFFIMHRDRPSLEKRFAIFGTVGKESMKVVDAIAETEVELTPDGTPSPVEDIIIKKATVMES